MLRRITLLASLTVLVNGCVALEKEAVPPVAQRLWIAVWSYDVPGEQEYFEQLKTDFCAENPGVTVKIELAEWDDAHDKIKSWIEHGNGPDIVVVPDIWIVEFNHGIEPLTAYIDPAMREEFFPVLYNKGTYRGHLVGLVWATSSKALFYRKDLFAAARLQPPKTWEDQLEAAIRLNNPPHVYGLGLPGKREYETDDNFYFYFWSAGGEFFIDGKSAINSDAGIKALQFYVDLINKYHVTQPEVTSWSRKETRKLFEAGRLAMFATGPWGIESLRANAPQIPFGVTPLPVDKKPTTQIITDHIVLLKASRAKHLAWRFVEFAYQDKHRLAYAKLGLVPEKISVANDHYFQEDPDWKVFIDVIPTAEVIPLMNWEQIGIETREAMYQAITGRRTPKEALDDLAGKINELIVEPPQQNR